MSVWEWYNVDMKKTFPLFMVLLFSISLAIADTTKKNPDVEQALRLTQEMLKNPEARQNQINKSSQGKAADAKVKEVAGSPENEQAMYELAASVFASVSDQAGGDPEKMQKILDEALRNPESFANQWSPEQIKKLEEISAKSEKSQNKVGSSNAAPSDSSASDRPKKLGPSRVTTKPIKK